MTNDHLGSPRVITNASGNVTSRRDFAPFGEDLYTSQRTTQLGYQPDNTRQRFTGYEKDQESGLNFAQARYQNSNFGRFMSPDPLMASARRINPQTFNRYSYVINNPLNLIDPLGLAPCPPEYPNCLTDKDGYDYIVGNGENVYVDARVTGDAPPNTPPPAAGFQAPMPSDTRLQPGRVTIPGFEPEGAPGRGTGGARGGGIAGLILLFIELTTPHANGPAAECQINNCAPQTQPQTQNDDDNRMETLFRGVAVGHPGFADALNGVVRPIGGHSDPEEHNLGNTNSVFTSWTYDPTVAQSYAGPGGAFLTKEFSRREIIPSSNYFREAEVLIRGTVTGARVVILPK